MTTILIISPEPWEGHSVSKHHYAVELARQGHEVFFLDPPVSGLKTIKLKPVERAGAESHVVHSDIVARGLAKMPRLLRNFLERRWLEKLEKTIGKRIEVVWLFENSRFFDMRFAGDRLKIYHQVDLNQDFHPTTAAATADLAIAISGPVEARLKAATQRLLRLGHGVADLPEKPVSQELLSKRFGGEAFHAVITGNLDIRYLDVELVAGLVEENPQARFHLVGKYSKEGKLYNRIGTAQNVIWWGFMPPESLPSILRASDIALVTYLADDDPEQLANPHKVMEYLASGTPILATQTLEYADRPDLVDMAKDRGDFLRKFVSYGAAKKSTNCSKAQVEQEFRMQFANDHSYCKQIGRIVDTLDSILPNENPLKTISS